jgi:hypothetical protein
MLQPGLDGAHELGERLGSLDVRHVRPFNVSPNSAQISPDLRQESSTGWGRNVRIRAALVLMVARSGAVT